METNETREGFSAGGRLRWTAAGKCGCRKWFTDTGTPAGESRREAHTTDAAEGYLR